MEQWASGQQWGAAVAPKPPALISILATSSVIIRITRSSKRRHRSYQRLVLGACVGGAIQSIALLWGQWAVPMGTMGAVTAMGNRQTCAAQGFLLQMFGHMCHIYMTSLSLHGLLSVRSNFAQGKLIKAFEACTHVLAWLYPTSSAIVLRTTESFGANMAFCYVKPGLLLLYLGALPLVLSLTISTVVIVSLCLMVLHKERTCDSDTLQGKRQYREKARRKRSRSVLKQRFMYFVIMCLVYILLIVSRILLSADNVPFYIVGVVAFSLQGSLISLVYYCSVVSSGKEERMNSRMSSSVLGLHASGLSAPTTRWSVNGAIEDENVDKKDYEIYDGTNPSSQWAMFILEDEDSGDEFGYGTADETNYPQDATGQEEGGHTDVDVDDERKSTHEASPETEFRDEDIAENEKR